MAEGLTAGFWVPLDVIVQRMQIQVASCRCRARRLPSCESLFRETFAVFRKTFSVFRKMRFGNRRQLQVPVPAAIHLLPDILALERGGYRKAGLPRQRWLVHTVGL